MPHAMEQDRAQAYWDRVADGYDGVFPETLVGGLQRQAVWHELARVFKAEQRILELNCGTGIDAVYLAQRGVRVVACDLSPRMIAIAKERSHRAGVASLVDCRMLPTEEISTLTVSQTFDGAFSNFSGLNCVADLRSVARGLAKVLCSGAPVLFCMIGQYAPWEILSCLAHRNIRQAMSSRRARIVKQAHVQVHVPSVNAIAEAFIPDFRLETWRAIGVTVPPSSLNGFAQHFPRAVRALASVDRRIAGLPVIRNLGDSVLLHFERL